jgi:Ca-activated chloride channel homolog
MSIDTIRIDQIPDEQLTPATDDEAGLGALSTERGNLPLHKLDVRADITGLTVGLELTQTFRNPYDTPLEATYIFPLPDRAAVTRMTMTAGGRVIEGVLSERGAAREAYDTAIAAGKRASIAEEERPDVFTMRVGNILPGEDVTVALTLAGPLPFADGQAEFRFPLVVAPRYIPGAPLPGRPVGSGYGADTDAVPDGSRITPPVLLPGFPNPVALSIEVRIDPAGLALSALASSLHAVTEQDGLVRIQPGERVNRDFILRLSYQGDANSLVLVPDADGEGGTYRLTMLPPQGGAGTKRPRDLVLLLDRSGSMEGWKMVAARRAAARIVDTLTPADRFAVLTFDHEVGHPDRLPAGLVPATDRHRYRAVEHLARVDARGGTELVQPLREALSLLSAQSRERALVLVTDGQVGNEDQILRDIAPGLEGIRVHTVGIDQAVNAGFLGRLAGVGGGRCELVESEDRLDTAMDQIHRRIGAPSLTGLRISARDLSLVPDSASPARTPDLFAGVPLVVSGRYQGPAVGELRITGLTADERPWAVTVPATVANRPEVTKIWARGRLRDLEDQYAVNGSKDLEDTIVATSLRFGVLCRFTAYVAADVRVVTDGGSPHQVTQLVEQPAGWEMPMEADMLSSTLGSVQPASFGAAPVAYMPMVGGPVAASASAPAPQPGSLPAAPPSVSMPSPAPKPVGSHHEPVERHKRLRKATAGGAAQVYPASGYPGPGRAAGGGAPGGTYADMASAAPAPNVPSPELAAVIAQAAMEARRLREAAEELAGQRRDLLDDLASRLDALIPYLSQSGPHQAGLDTLRDLVALLRDTGIALEERWARALEALDALAATKAGAGIEGTGAGAGAPEPAPQRRAFWKR